MAIGGALEQVGNQVERIALLVGQAFPFGRKLAKQTRVSGGESGFDGALAGFLRGVGHGGIVTKNTGAVWRTLI